MASEVPRHSNGRPWIIVPGEEKAQSYIRASNLAKALSDSYALDVHHQKEVAIGLAENPWLIPKILGACRTEPQKPSPFGEVLRTNYYDHNELTKWIAVAKEKAGTSVKADYGTRLHSWTEVLDNGEDIDWDSLSPMEFSDVMGYLYFTDVLEMVDAETFCVNDEVESAGTFDRRVLINGRKRIGDLKTGRLKPMEFEMQLAIYARSQMYECQHELTLDGGDDGRPTREGCEAYAGSHVRSSLDVETDWGVIIHLPAGSGRAKFLRADLERGWRMVQTALEVKKGRAVELAELDLSTSMIPF